MRIPKNTSRAVKKMPLRTRVYIKVQDGLFSIQGLGIWYRYWQEPYHLMLTVPWLGFMVIMALLYLGLNACFAVLFLLGGDCILNARPGSFEDAFFFSVQTLASIGYGVMSPKTSYANLVVVLESIVGLFMIAVLTGITFARFSRPTAKVIFSKFAVIMPFDNLPTLVFRAANQRRNQILEAQVMVYFSRDEITAEGHRMRRFYELKLARSRTPSFSLPWTLMHQIDQTSPLYGVSRDELIDSQAQLIVSLSGLDETVSQNVHSRHTYGVNEMIPDHQLADIIHLTDDGDRYIDFSHFHEIEPI